MGKIILLFILFYAGVVFYNYFTVYVYIQRTILLQIMYFLFNVSSSAYSLVAFVLALASLIYYTCVLLFIGMYLGHQDTEGINKSLESLCVSMTNHALDGKSYSTRAALIARILGWNFNVDSSNENESMILSKTNVVHVRLCCSRPVIRIY